VKYDNNYVVVDIFTGESEQIDFSQELKYVKKDGNILALVNEK
jgi:hypothetical protein